MKINQKTINYDSNNKSAELYYIVFDSFFELESYINMELVDIMHADSIYNLNNTRKELLSFIEAKTTNQKYGIVAEFFSHITLRKLGYTQRCIFKNLEESSMKKGFDGLYAMNDEFWLAESKSAYINSTHTAKIQEAISDLRNKVEILGKNNPWMNAAHHILVRQNGKGDDAIATKIKKLSVEYQSGHINKLEEFNIIPISTLFFKTDQDVNIISSWCEKFLDDKKYNKIMIICLENHIYVDFLTYLEN